MTDDYGNSVTVEPEQMAVPDKVFDNPAVQERWAVTVQQIAWGLIALAIVTMLGVFGLALRGDVPDTIVLLGTTVATGCISGLVGYIAGRRDSSDNA